jgi:hypothetical protein
MTKLRNLFVNLPNACSVQNELATLDGKRNGGWFDFELKNPDSILKKIPGQTTKQRLSPAFNGWRHLADPYILEFSERFTTFIADRVLFNEKGIGDLTYLLAEESVLRILEKKYTSISSIYSVDDAVIQGNWS